jgi:hypothetical protein
MKMGGESRVEDEQRILESQFDSDYWCSFLIF